MAQQITVGVHHVSATLSARVWLMTAAICCPILLVSTSHVAFSAARNTKKKKKNIQTKKLMVDSSLNSIDKLTLRYAVNTL